ncbi:DNA topoisomerase IV [Poritiphilus flavus]|uniref:DNA topoisomerase IV n=1 Tax=Poritiphilus flavus TaxID=2697053 RepID=A0A6L9EFL1_9FLAO|nr:DNA topoisomerase IV [Poritiphilus flavus]NAS13537.1 DNA topoisomerase IV [Poritiphilus flavus]
MIKKGFLLLLIPMCLTNCYEPQRNCADFKNGAFSFTTLIDGEEKTTTFIREGDIEVDFFEGGRDSASVRWINDCEYIIKNLSPKNRAEEQSIHMKILSTSENSYTFEYGIVGDSRKSKGTAVKITAEEAIPKN